MGILRFLSNAINGFIFSRPRIPDGRLPAGGRRLAAIMFTDMVGYTALTQTNEPLALKALAKHQHTLRPIFKKFHGREIKTIGDSFLVEFPSALEATNCAVEIQQFLHDYNITSRDDWKIRLRIGIHLGDVIHASGDLLGDAVNIASRIEPFAEAEGICVTEPVFEEVRNKITQPILKLGPRGLKNVQFPVNVYKVGMPWEGTIAPTASFEKPASLRIAVLPFANMSPDPGDEYFADGMTEELIDRLSQMRELRVIARTSIMGYKKKDSKVSEIAKELGVGKLVEGSVRKAGNKIRVAVQLIDADTEEHLWSSSYDKNLDDVFSIQREISEKVSDGLRLNLIDSEKRILQRSPTEKTEAYGLYLKGRYYWNQRTKPSVEKGISYLQKALDEDPNLAVAYSDLADAYVVMADYGMIAPADALSKCQQYATKALTIDPNLSQPHAALACVHGTNFRWEGALKEFDLAIRLNPNNATAHHWYAVHLSVLGNKRALDEWRIARELDPLSLIMGAAFGYYLVRTGQKEEGLEMIRSVIEMSDTFVFGHCYLAYAYVMTNMKAEALEETKKIVTLDKDGENASDLAIVYAALGLKDEAAKILDRLLRESSAHYTDPSVIASVYAALGDPANSLEWLEKAVSENSAGAAYANYIFAFDSLRDNPRFRELTKRMGLE